MSGESKSATPRPRRGHHANAPLLEGVRVSRNQAVDIFWPEEDGEWYVGRISHVTEDPDKPLVVAVYGDELVADGKDEGDNAGKAGVQREGAELPPDKMWRLRLRADRPVRVDRSMPSQPFVSLRGEVESYHSDSSTATRAATRVRKEREALGIAQKWHVLMIGHLCAQLLSWGAAFGGSAMMVEVFSGPYRSMSNALQVGSAGARLRVCVTRVRSARACASWAGP
jgi:hypothetical protein